MSDERQIPTRIIEKPEIRKLGGRKQRALVCDNGMTYTVNELADLLGLTGNILNWRLNNWGWNSSDLLMPKLADGSKKSAKPDKRQFESERDSNWGGLGNRVRNHNLNTIAEPTEFDLMYGCN